MKQLKINGVVVNATQFITDDCHKIYVLDSAEGREQVLSRGWSEADFRPVSELPAVWDDTCPLRFISSADLDRQYIAQGSKEAGKVGIVTYGDDDAAPSQFHNATQDGQVFKATPLGAPVEGEPGGYDVGYDDLKDWAKPTKVEVTDFVGGNNLRAWYGAKVLIASTDLVGQDEYEGSLADIVSNLRHLSDALGVDWDAVTDRADRWYDGEIHGVL